MNFTADAVRWVVMLMMWLTMALPASVLADDLPTLEKIAGAKRRNVIFILTDDHRYDAMGFMGHPFLETPNMDQMAAQGVHIKNAFVTTSLCSPSRASILTGLYTHKHQVIDNQRLVPEGTLFFPQYLQKSGYSTGFFGKWHMGSGADNPRPGFDHWVSFRGQGNYYSPSDSYTINVNGKRVKQDRYVTDMMTDYAVEWLKEQSDDKPFFMYLSHKAVHANFTPAKRHAGRYAQTKVALPQGAGVTAAANSPRWVRDQRNGWHGIDFPYHSDKGLEDLYRNYCETLLAVDESIGRVMQTLKEKGIHDQTLVIYMGDNGFLFGEHGLIDKRVSYEPSIRVPMMMQCPELFPGGQTMEQVIGNIDVGPTILKAAGLKAPDYMDGRSFLDLPGNPNADWRDAFLYVYYWEKNFPHTPTQFALRTDRYKYITYYGLWDTDELYDLKDDPEELNNLIDHPQLQDTVKQMENRLYGLLGEEGGMQIPMNQPRGHSRNKRWTERGGQHAADFPARLTVEKPINKDAK